MNDDCLGSLLPKAKREHRRGIDDCRLDALINEGNVVELLEIRIDVVCISVSWNEAGTHDLSGSAWSE